MGFRDKEQQPKPKTWASDPDWTKRKVTLGQPKPKSENKDKENSK